MNTSELLDNAWLYRLIRPHAEAIKAHAKGIRTDTVCKKLVFIKRFAVAKSFGFVDCEICSLTETKEILGVRAYKELPTRYVKALFR